MNLRAMREMREMRDARCEMRERGSAGCFASTCDGPWPDNSVQSSSSEDSSSSDEINEESDNIDSDLCIINPVKILHKGDSNHSVIDNVEVAPFVSRKKSLIYNSHNINGKFFKIHWNIFVKHNVNNCIFFSLRQR